MALQPGSHLGPYEILAPLGAGGMGEVYKARDTQLGREVAIKTLPASRVANEENKRRFLQEARAASALNHPGIVTIHDISRSGEVDYIVMEYVRGRTLDRVIGKHGLGVQESIRYALQMADALARAHAAGIIHRDLKPGNIMVTDDGLVKILDFGLAKLGEVEAIGEGDATRTIRMQNSPHTQDGAVVGTVAYMSPEQAEGKKVDARSDIFSFGAVLYEMVTGRRAFTGDSSASTMAAVLKSDPKPPSQVVEGIPRDLERIILRCLRKDPARRFQHATDLKVDLEELKESTGSGESAQPAAKTTKSSKLPWIAAAVALPVLVTVGWLLRPAGEATAPPLEPVPLTTYEGVESRAILFTRREPSGFRLGWRKAGQLRPLCESSWNRFARAADKRLWPATLFRHGRPMGVTSRSFASHRASFSSHLLEEANGSWSTGLERQANSPGLRTVNTWRSRGPHPTRNRRGSF